MAQLRLFIRMVKYYPLAVFGWVVVATIYGIRGSYEWWSLDSVLTFVRLHVAIRAITLGLLWIPPSLYYAIIKKRHWMY